MTQFVISANSSARDLFPVAMVIHELLGGLPVTARSAGQPGLRIEHGRVVSESYTGPVLEAAITNNKIIKVTPESGAYRGVPVVVAPLRNSSGEAIGAVGVVDITGIFDLATLMEHQSAIIQQVCGRDPCPLPSESIDAKR
ncbi:MAG: DUF2111 domain-containing protein [Methanomicrobiales archaeon]|nr:DUF2111 domain-containing protein [Methanomicrobiales archaeon]